MNILYNTVTVSVFCVMRVLNGSKQRIVDFIKKITSNFLKTLMDKVLSVQRRCTPFVLNCCEVYEDQ